MAKYKKTILVVDDVETDRKILKDILKDFDVIEAESGYSAQSLIIERRFDLDAIFLDVSMRGVDGFGVLKHMQEKRLRSIPVFMATADATTENVTKAAQYNVASFIKKPLDREEVLCRLKVALNISD